MSKFLILIFSLLLLIGCKKDSIISIQDSFPGYYKAIKITSTIPVDLNNDGLKSTNIYMEISKPFIGPNNQAISLYNFASSSNYMEVRPLSYHQNSGKLIAFNFPHQDISYLSNGIPFLMWYTNEFIAFSYEFKNNHSITVTSTNPEYTNRIGEIDSLILKENGVVLVSLKENVFDFVDRAWQKIDITVEYSKIP